MPSFLWGLLGGPHHGCAPGSGKVLGRAARRCRAQLSCPRGGCGQGAAACWCQGRRNFGVELPKRALRGAAVCCWSCHAHSSCQSKPHSIEIKCALTELLFMDLQGLTSMQPASCSHAGCPKEGRQALAWRQVLPSHTALCRCCIQPCPGSAPRQQRGHPAVPSGTWLRFWSVTVAKGTLFAERATANPVWADGADVGWEGSETVLGNVGTLQCRSARALPAAAVGLFIRLGPRGTAQFLAASIKQIL